MKLFQPAVFKDSHEIEDRLVREFFGPKRGVFIDIGANEPSSSLSAHLENDGWRGVLVEPLPGPASRLRQVRKSPVVEAACTSPAKVGTAEFHVGHNTEHSSLIEDKAFGVYVDTITVKTTTVDQIIIDHQFEHVDLLSIDTEGAELEVLAGVTFTKHKPSLVLIEDHAVNFSRHRFMRSVGYKLIRRTGFNGWYVPEETPWQISVYGYLQLFRKYILSMPVKRFRRWRWQFIKRGVLATNK